MELAVEVLSNIVEHALCRQGLVAYGAGAAVANLMMMHAHSPLSERLVTLCCHILRRLAEAPQCRPQLLLDGVAQALMVVCEWHTPTPDSVIHVHSLACIAALAACSAADAAEPFASGSVGTFITQWGLTHCQWFSLMLTPLRALGRVALLPTAGLAIDPGEAIKMVTKAVGMMTAVDLSTEPADQDWRLGDEMPRSYDVLREASLTAFLLKKRFGAALPALSTLQLPGSHSSGPGLHFGFGFWLHAEANLLWACANGTDAEIAAAIAAAAAASPVSRAARVRGSRVQALHLAAAAGRTAAVEALLANFDAAETVVTHAASNALQLAAQNGHVSLVERLMQYWLRGSLAADASAALGLAAANGHMDVLEMLLSTGAFSSGAEADSKALRSGAEGGTEALSSGDEAGAEAFDSGSASSFAEGCSDALWMAAAHGQSSAAERLLTVDHRAHPVARNAAALRLACRNGHGAIVSRLLADSRLPQCCATLCIMPKNARISDFRWHSVCAAAFTAASRSCRIEVMEALVRDPRIDSTDAGLVELRGSEETATLTGSGCAPQAIRRLLARQPSIMRKEVLSYVFGASSRTGEYFMFDRQDVMYLYSAAWNRRRHGVRAWSIARVSQTNYGLC